ncbi:MAG: hypothetical protein IPM56_05485 [Ignavibacteriales bacterium]|nr:MAG: hypothetical protein IPM56_05485 [Ignavibacteriales bacterium]
MRKKIQLIPSGIALVDNAWSGFYRGGTYLLIGPRKSGRTLIGLQYAMECARQKEVCLYFTSMRPKDLLIHAASIDFDLQHYMNQNQIIVVRVAPPGNLAESNNPDPFLAEYLKDIVTVVEQYQPTKIVFDELTPFIGFNDVNLLQEVFLQATESIEEASITSLFIIGDPATQGARTITDALAAYSTGVIYLQKKEDSHRRTQGGRMIITPNVGHTEGQFKADYHIEPYKGVTVDFEDNKDVVTSPKKYSRTGDTRYRSLSEMEISKEDIFFSNLYTINDFSLIVNNQIALFKSTGQVFTMVSFRLDMSAETKGILTLNQLQNAIRLSTDRKDKICAMKNKIVVLMTKEDQKGLNSLLAKIRSNLPGTDPVYLNKAMQYISVFAAIVNDKIENADDMFQQLLVDESQEKDQPGYY